MAVPFPTLDWVLERRTSSPTPLLLKVAIGIQGLFVFSSTQPAAALTGIRTALPFLAIVAVATAVLTALWNMKRWPLVVLSLMGVVRAASTLPHYFAVTTRSLPAALVFALAILAIQNIALIAAVRYWRRMSWK